MTLSLNLKYHSADNGNCRIYYTADRNLYCWQLSTKTEFELYACTRDGEPECHVRKDVEVKTERPKGDETIEEDLIKFLDL